MPRNTLLASRVPRVSWASKVSRWKARRPHAKNQWTSWGIRALLLVAGPLWPRPYSIGCLRAQQRLCPPACPGLLHRVEALAGLPQLLREQAAPGGGAACSGLPLRVEALPGPPPARRRPRSSRPARAASGSGAASLGARGSSETSASGSGGAALATASVPASGGSSSDRNCLRAASCRARSSSASGGHSAVGPGREPTGGGRAPCDSARAGPPGAAPCSHGLGAACSVLVQSSSEKPLPSRPSGESGCGPAFREGCCRASAGSGLPLRVEALPELPQCSAGRVSRPRSRRSATAATGSGSARSPLKSRRFGLMWRYMRFLPSFTFSGAIDARSLKSWAVRRESYPASCSFEQLP
mmetsp:Transcript_111238/g.301945  ORF Transcript_111238/g.301945 Transcript_111238/m.301945 type:complete len:355 (+) Transcript_111238:1-1065(+)